MNPPASTIQRTAIDHEIFDHGKRLGSPGLDPNFVAVVERPHVELASGRAALGAVRRSVYDQPTRPTNALAAIVFERDWLFTFVRQTLVNRVQHLEEGHVRIYVGHLVPHETALVSGVLLAPHVQNDIHHL
jgi:hypothetical protein